MKTGERRVLVIGSQCRELNPLSFLPAAAEDLYQVLTTPDLGSCVPALPDGVGLLLDPSVAEAKAALRTAFTRTSEDGATLLLAYIGHGESVYDDFYLLPVDASATPDSDSGLHLVQLIRELYGRHSFVDGLVVLLDACYAGVAAAGAAARWVGKLGADSRFVVLTATADRTAADGCFSRALTQLIREGIASSPGEYLAWEEVRVALSGCCPLQNPQLPRNNDEGLFLARNAVWPARRWSAAGTVVASEIERLTAWFQPTPPLEAVAAASQTCRGVRVVGDAGVGKSALAAALIRWEVTEDRAPKRFAQAIVFLTPVTSSTELAAQFAAQLSRSLPDFTAAQARFQRDTPESEWKGLDALQREVQGPLRLVGMDSPLRLVFDGLDQLAVGTESAVYAALDALVSDPALKGVRVVATSRPDTPSPDGFKEVFIGAVADEFITRYLAQRGLPPGHINQVVERTRGNWLIARLLGDLLVANPTANPGTLPSDLIGLYERNLKQVGAAERGRWLHEFRPILGVLAAAGVGSMLPLPLLCAASGKLNGPSRQARVRDTLFYLRGLVIRSAPGTAGEHVGVFHQTLVEYLLNPAHVFGSDPEDAHIALADAIAELAPRAEHDWKSPLHAYARDREAEHLWAAGRHDQIIECLEKCAFPIPADNLRRWQSWAERLRPVYGPDHPHTLTTRANIATWTGETGDAATALRLLQELLPVRQRVLGTDHPDTLRTRHGIASWIGATGEIATALRLLQELLPVRQRVLGFDHPDTLITCADIASWTGRIGDAATALRLLQELLPVRQRVLGHDHPAILITRHNIAAWTRLTGDAATALHLFQELLPARQQVLGPDHPSTLITRSQIASCTGETGDIATALRLFQELLTDRLRVCGPDHPRTLDTRSNIAQWTGEAGDATTALSLFEALLPDWLRIRGPDYPRTLETRSNIAQWTGEAGDAATALRLFQELLPDSQRVSGPDHPDTLEIRSNIARWTWETGDAATALQQAEEVLADMERVLGPDHPRTVTVRDRLRGWRKSLGQSGDSSQS
ncbi:MAG TPA: tetratricopeptide repeat protein [Candidatus Competibacter phosphatis]|nr:tetratricopeptide repeat protein [Candidatus Competibacter phosphatis]